MNDFIFLRILGSIINLIWSLGFILFKSQVQFRTNLPLLSSFFLWSRMSAVCMDEILVVSLLGMALIAMQIYPRCACPIIHLLLVHSRLQFHLILVRYTIE